MSKKKINWTLVNKLIISIEILLFWVLGLIVCSLYYSWNFKGFIYDNTNTVHFWSGFGMLSAVIIFSGLVLAALLGTLLRFNDLMQYKRKEAKKA